jgi:4-amino-4-deoxychorismate lyase
MSLLFETIRIERGIPLNLSFHEERMNRSRFALFGKTDFIALADQLSIPPPNSKIIRCKVIYEQSVLSVAYSQYEPAKISTLKLVDAGTLDYEYKYLDRNQLTSLIDKSVADDILIVRNGCIADASFANITFTDGKHWFTPDTPLLKGTMREYLLKTGIIQTERITADNLKQFTFFRLINAMLGFYGPLVPVTNII